MLDFVKVASTKGLVPCGDSGEPACDLAQFFILVEKVIDFMLLIAIPIAVAVIIYGGFLLMTSGGSEQRVSQGKQAILAAIIGLAITFGSLIIIKLLGLAIGYNFNL